MDVLCKKTSMDDKVAELQARYLKLEEQIKDLEFYKECCINRYVQEIKGFYSMEFPYNPEFYDALLDKNNEKYKRNSSVVKNILKECLSDDIKIKNYMALGLSTYGFIIEFTSKKENYELIVPIMKNISRREIGDEKIGSIDWNIAKFKLLKYESKNSLKTVWSGYRLTECDYFKEKDDDGTDNKEC